MPLTPDEEILFKLSAHFIRKEPVIFDVGAYKGAYTEFVLSVTPEASCFLFEPNTKLCRELLSRGHNAFELVLQNVVDERDFFRCAGNADELSSTYRRSVFDQSEPKISVVTEIKQGVTLDFFCAHNGFSFIDFLKIDVEGAELDVLQGSTNMLSEKKVTFLQVEYGGTYPDAGITFMQVIDFMKKYGYNVYELINDKLSPVTKENFVEDFRFSNFLITHIDICQNQ